MVEVQPRGRAPLAVCGAFWLQQLPGWQEALGRGQGRAGGVADGASSRPSSCVHLGIIWLIEQEVMYSWGPKAPSSLGHRVYRGEPCCAAVSSYGAAMCCNFEVVLTCALLSCFSYLVHNEQDPQASGCTCHRPQKDVQKPAKKKVQQQRNICTCLLQAQSAKRAQCTREESTRGGRTSAAHSVRSTAPPPLLLSLQPSGSSPHLTKAQNTGTHTRQPLTHPRLQQGHGAGPPSPPPRLQQGRGAGPTNFTLHRPHPHRHPACSKDTERASAAGSTRTPSSPSSQPATSAAPASRTGGAVDTHTWVVASGAEAHHTRAGDRTPSSSSCLQGGVGVRVRSLGV